MISKYSSGKFFIFMIVLICFYYPIGVLISYLFKINSTVLNTTIRGASSIFFFSTLLFELWKKKCLVLTYQVLSLLIFWIFYSIRIIFDLSQGINFGDYDDTVVYGIAFGNILIPIISIIISSNRFDILYFHKILHLFLILCNLSNLLTQILQNTGLNYELFLTRPHVQSTNNSQENTNILNPIQIGFFGMLLYVSSLSRLLFFKNTKVKFDTIFLILGILLTILGASRGPFINGFITTIILITTKFFTSKKGFTIDIKFVFTFLSFTTIIFFLSWKYISIDDIYIFQRLSSFYNARQDNQLEYRDIMYTSAWHDFLDSPIIGKQFVGTLDNYYPHNIFLEILMATGLVGAILVISFLIPVFYRIALSLKYPTSPYFYLIAIYVPIALSALFSGAMFQSIDLWLLLSLIISVPYKAFSELKV